MKTIINAFLRALLKDALTISVGIVILVFIVALIIQLAPKIDLLLTSVNYRAIWGLICRNYKEVLGLILLPFVLFGIYVTFYEKNPTLK